MVDGGADVLGGVLGFTSAELDENRAGRVTERQLDSVTGLAQAEGRMGAGCGSLGLVLLLVLAGVVVPAAAAEARSTVVVVFAVLVLAVAAWLVLLVRRSRRILRPRLRVTEGAASCEVRRRGPTEYDAGALEIILRVGAEAFRVTDHRVPAVVDDGTHLRVWWLPGPTGPVLLSAEPVAIAGG